jgi:hypothetical protein
MLFGTFDHLLRHSPLAIKLMTFSEFAFCDLWSFDPGALGLLHAAGANDPEFEASVRERNERSLL